jgi:hypothetical protein
MVILAVSEPVLIGMPGATAIRDAYAEQPPVLARRHLLLAQPRVARRLGGVEAFDEAGLVPDDAGGDPIGKFLRPNQIATPHLEGIDAERPGSHVHQPLGNERRDRPADAAVRTGRRLAGRDAANRSPV